MLKNDKVIIKEKEDELIKNLDGRSMQSHWEKVLPTYQPRETQVHVMDWINTLPPDVKYILCEIPVGGGKSPLAIAYSSYLNNGLGNSFILTPQKTLQRQYENSFDSTILASLYGKANYTCDLKNTNCDIGSDIKPACENCPAKEARATALMSYNMVLNYAVALTYFKYLPHKIPPRDLMVFDECHTLENHLVEFSSIDISEFKCKKYNAGKFHKPKNISSAITWIKNTYQPAVSSKLSELREKVKEIDDRFDSRLTKEDQKNIKMFKSATEHAEQLRSLLGLTLEQIEKKYVLIIDKTYFKFKELYGKSNFRNLLLPKANRFLFMSSTILDKEEFCNDLGIDPKHAAMISTDSEFNVKNREVFYKQITKMTYGWNKPEKVNERKKMLSAINHICNYHSDESGIIHTGSFQVAEWLVENIKDTNHEILHHNPSSEATRDEVIDYYLNNSEHKPLLLISPSITEGMDLMDDKGRFAIIVKVPYPFLGDAWIKKRMQISKQWYNRQAITGIIQACGRIVRSKDDHGQVYILDESFEYLYKQTRNIIPQWWKDGVIVL